ncbi:MAG: hypothetical protein ABI613_05810, partial [Gemmatimonadota bacterium]
AGERRFHGEYSVWYLVDALFVANYRSCPAAPLQKLRNRRPMLPEIKEQGPDIYLRLCEDQEVVVVIKGTEHQEPIAEFEHGVGEIAAGGGGTDLPSALVEGGNHGGQCLRIHSRARCMVYGKPIATDDDHGFNAFPLSEVLDHIA